MIKSFITKITFTRVLSHQEQYSLWRQAIKSIRSIAVSGATQFENSLEWSIDYSDSQMDESEAKQCFSDFLSRQKEIIEDFSFYQYSSN